VSWLLYLWSDKVGRSHRKPVSNDRIAPTQS
jgi:hypothetical protein